MIQYVPLLETNTENLSPEAAQIVNARILEYFYARGREGAIAEEAEIGCGLKYQTVSTQISKLVRAGLLVEIGIKRIANETNRPQLVRGHPDFFPELNCQKIEGWVNMGQALPTVDGGWGTICADPPWRFENVASRGAAEDHYETMSVHEICALPVEKIVAKNAMLYLWVTDAHLPDVFRLDLFGAWGFRFVQAITWLKVKDGRPQMGLGNYYRHASELLLFGVRGKAKVMRHDALNFLCAPREEHSSKPDLFQFMIGDMSPGPHLELFARRALPGWASWGLEAPSPLSSSIEGVDNV